MTQPLRFGVNRRVLMLAAGATLAAPAVLRAQGAAEDVVVTTDLGRLRGQRQNGVDVFKGVPYGAPVSGEGRFKPARPAEPWTGVRDALRLGTPAMQDASTVYGLNEPAPGEDCLYLNVWAPAGGGRGKPVMFYCHGGGYTTGSGGSTSQDGANIARQYDVVVVSTNHRLGLLGYIDLSELGGPAYQGNQGLSDIALGLQWVKRNIAAFGGDPNNVLLFGESGGGAKTSCLYAMPTVAPLFHKAAIQSGPTLRVQTRQQAAATTRKLLEVLNIAPADWRRLHEIPAADFLKAQQLLQQRNGPDPAPGWSGITDVRPGVWGPVVDGKLLPRQPFQPDAPATARDKPLMVGFLDEEASFFAWAGKDVAAYSLTEAGLRQRLADLGPDLDEVLRTYRADRPGATPTDLFFAIQTARSFGLGSIRIAELKASQGAAPVFFYNLAYRSNRRLEGAARDVGAMHAIDIPIVFDNVASGDTLAGNRPDVGAVADNMSEMFATFARTGQPSAKGQPAWPAYDLKTRATMVIDAQCQVVPDRFGAERKLWGRVDPLGRRA
ncbi:carboxylesterase/lipase family protein [Phenylobacterium deserti]|uniref:Carboxylic ester hydrolase n=1 Tax=Phenylobacterium deserti TaxID=1914756 RepID=A0A328A8S2_9CAUL|nr:carboxylesterase family protein [Phenylobacterium deserti]RAK50951.1 carboxylesterase/lipase family protein [Phenylobacterium deserti]